MSNANGVRLNRRHQDMVRAKIQASQLINRLNDHAMGEVELTPTQVKSIEILLRKSVPDLSAVSIEGPGENGELIHRIERSVVRPGDPVAAAVSEAAASNADADDTDG